MITEAKYAKRVVRKMLIPPHNDWEPVVLLKHREGVVRGRFRRRPTQPPNRAADTVLALGRLESAEGLARAVAFPSSLWLLASLVGLCLDPLVRRLKTAKRVISEPYFSACPL